MKLKYRIKFVGSDVLTDYDGMNYYAAREIGFDCKIQENEILVNESLNFSEVVHTIIHEIAEAEKMKLGWHYWQAHRHAYAVENNVDNLKTVANKIKRCVNGG